MSHLLVTNDFAPKIGGIQTYLSELWRRLPAGEATVLTTAYPGAALWDPTQPFPIHRVGQRVLLPRRSMVERVRRLAADVDAKLAVIDPALPLGLMGPALGMPYVVVVHGAEITVPGRLPVLGPRLARVLRGARGIVAAGEYPADEARRLVDADNPEVVVIPPGVDTARFGPIDAVRRQEVCRRFDLPESGSLLLTASRLVPRKGVDVLIKALPHLVPHHPRLTLAVAGAGRDAGRLRTLAARLGVGARVRFLGRVPDADLADLYGTADIFAMLCRNRWGGLEQEGFGIVFLEAAACGVPQVAGQSGGAADAVVDGVTGFVIDPPTATVDVARAIARLLDDDGLRQTMGDAGRRRAEQEFHWDGLAMQLHQALQRWTP
jgi:phosphatidylinositol alpha-1,6-mannosyltransferase